MTFAVHTRTQPGVTDRDPTFYILDDGAGGRAEVWPALGFNCLHWEAVRDGQKLDLLYADPALFTNGRPTRSGIPVLFPFPNRIRDGRFTWDGKEYQLPLNDGTLKNAIHGFACRKPWRVVGQGADASSAWVVGEFQTLLDAPECLPLWPADHLIRITYRLGTGSLRVEAEVVNPDERTLPFGLGYHPYYRMPFAPGATAADCLIEAPAQKIWPLVESLPADQPQPLDPAHNLNTPRRFGDLELDDVLTALSSKPGADGLRDCGTMRSGAAMLRLLASPAFRELVVFTPPHREAFCIEPYTCTTDAINLQASGVDAGWLTLAPGERWTADFEMRLDSPTSHAKKATS
jgi:aldose 1-epimerase